MVGLNTSRATSGIAWTSEKKDKHRIVKASIVRGGVWTERGRGGDGESQSVMYVRIQLVYVPVDQVIVIYV